MAIIDVNGQKFETFENTDFPGNDIKSIARTPNLVECARACANEPGAIAFTYNKVNGICYLKNPVPNKVSHNQGTSGIKQL